MERKNNMWSDISSIFLSDLKKLFIDGSGKKSNKKNGIWNYVRWLADTK